MHDLTLPAKTCKDCGQTKPLDEFNRQARGAQGRRAECKPCVVRRRPPEYAAQYQRLYRERQKAAGLCSSCLDPVAPGRTVCERHAAKSSAWWQDRREYAREHQRRVRAKRNARPEDQLLADQMRLRPDGLKLCKRRAAHAGPIPVGQFWRAPGEADGLCPVCKACSIEIYRKRAERHWRAVGIPFLCTYCGGPYEHVDHVIPRKRGGTDAVENTMPACRPCNQSKGSRLLSEWRPELTLAA